MRWMKWAAVVVTAALLPRQAAAQAATGRVGGEVRDTTGAVVAHGMAHLRELDTNLDWSQHMDGAGHFVFLALPVGRYELTVSCDRFRTVRSETPNAVATPRPRSPACRRWTSSARLYGVNRAFLWTFIDASCHGRVIAWQPSTSPGRPGWNNLSIRYT